MENLNNYFDYFDGLVFCKDGVLRIKKEYKGKHIFYPLLEIQKDKKSKLSILSLLNRMVAIESGTTIGSILIALHPWSNILTHVFNINFSKYADESIKLSNLNNNIKKTKNNNLDKIIIKKSLSIDNDDVFSSNIVNDCYINEINTNIQYSMTIPFSLIYDIPVFISDYLLIEYYNKNNIKHSKSKIEIDFYSFLDAISNGLFHEEPLTEDEYNNFIESLNTKTENRSGKLFTSVDELINSLNEDSLPQKDSDENIELFNKFKKSRLLRIGNINRAVLDD